MNPVHVSDMKLPCASPPFVFVFPFILRPFHAALLLSFDCHRRGLGFFRARVVSFAES